MALSRNSTSGPAAPSHRGEQLAQIERARLLLHGRQVAALLALGLLGKTGVGLLEQAGRPGAATGVVAPRDMAQLQSQPDANRRQEVLDVALVECEAVQRANALGAPRGLSTLWQGRLFQDRKR
ncbi:MAG: hypothetical protein JWQ88_1779 [Rhodoferax sp.]|nr:hypothetical protein [Rhodoferax sp.]